MKVSSEKLINFYKLMLRIRFAEEILVKPIIDGEIKCPCHLYSGQEAVAVGVCSALNKEDYIFGNHRSHGHYIAKGGSISAMFSEIYGAEAGCSCGRGGSMHLIDMEKGMLGAAPIVAGTISLAVGASLAAKIRKDKRIAVSFFGDGSSGEGVLFESLNCAALWKLPIVFVCENNLYSTHMPILECRPNIDIYKMGIPLGIDSCKIDGNDVFEVYKTATDAIRKCRNGDGPVLIECMTYRLRGHVGPDDNVQGSHTDIRPLEEIKAWRQKDPIDRFVDYMLERKIIKKNELDRIKKEIEQEVQSMHNAAKFSQKPTKDTLLNNVFKN